MSIWTGSLVEPLAGDFIDATDQHQTYEAVKALTDPWTAYTPVWRSSGTQPALGNGTLTGAYRQSGKFGQFHILLTVGSTSTFGTGIYRFDSPNSWTFSSDRLHGLSMITDATGNVYLGGTIVATGGLVTCRVHGLTLAASPPTATVPMTWATGDKWYLQWQGEVEP